MHIPFPGMNPYLEQPGLWPQVHHRLIVAMADAITPQMAPNYRVSIEERIYTTTDPLPLVGIADVSGVHRHASGDRLYPTPQTRSHSRSVRLADDYSGTVKAVQLGSGPIFQR